MNNHHHCEPSANDTRHRTCSQRLTDAAIVTRRCTEAATGPAGVLNSRAGSPCAPGSEPPRASSSDDLPEPCRPSAAATARPRAEPQRRSHQRSVPEAQEGPIAE